MTVSKGGQARSIGLLVATGLIVSWVRHGLQHQWHGFESWESFFTWWFIHTIGVGVFSVFAAAAVIGTHRFFLDDDWKGDHEHLVFYVVVTVLVGAFAIAVVANASASDDDARLLLSTLIG